MVGIADEDRRPAFVARRPDGLDGDGKWPGRGCCYAWMLRRWRLAKPVDDADQSVDLRVLIHVAAIPHGRQQARESVLSAGKASIIEQLFNQPAGEGTGGAFQLDSVQQRIVQIEGVNEQGFAIVIIRHYWQQDLFGAWK